MGRLGGTAALQIDSAVDVVNRHDGACWHLGDGVMRGSSLRHLVLLLRVESVAMHQGLFDLVNDGLVAETADRLRILEQFLGGLVNALEVGPPFGLIFTPMPSKQLR